MLFAAHFMSRLLSLDIDQTLTMKAGHAPAASARALAKILLLSRP